MKHKLIFAISILALAISLSSCSGEKEEAQRQDLIPTEDEISIMQESSSSKENAPSQDATQNSKGEEDAKEIDGSKGEIDITELNPESPAPPLSSREGEGEAQEKNDEDGEKIPQQEVIIPQNQHPVIENQQNPAEIAPKPEESHGEDASPQEAISPVSYDEKRAIWISYLDFGSLLQGKSRAEFKNNISGAFSKISALGLNTVIVQVRPFGDALYPSKLFPWSKVASGDEGVSPGFDPLQIMVDEARARDLKIEAWINPYRVRAKGSFEELSKDNIARAWQGSDDVISFNGGIYYNPASAKARKLIVDGVTEIVKNYDIDAIHFDDYFYPTTDPSFDSSSYAKSETPLSLDDWRRENVNTLVREVYSAIKAQNPRVKFGISPGSSIEKNYSTHYVDAKKWLSTNGYVDYIMPQIYHGFSNSKMPFAKAVSAWSNLIKADVSLEIGLSPYKLGNEDKYAGDGRYEWLEADDILKNMTELSRGAKHYGGIALFRYDSVFNPEARVKAIVDEELSSLKSIF